MLDGCFMEALDRQLVDPRKLQETANQRFLAFLNQQPESKPWAAYVF